MYINRNKKKIPHYHYKGESRKGINIAILNNFFFLGGNNSEENVLMKVKTKRFMSWEDESTNQKQTRHDRFLSSNALTSCFVETSL